MPCFFCLTVVQVLEVNAQRPPAEAWSRRVLKTWNWTKNLKLQDFIVDILLYILLFHYFM